MPPAASGFSVRASFHPLVVHCPFVLPLNCVLPDIRFSLLLGIRSLTNDRDGE